uniref:Ribonuclease P/MRP subunit p30 n=1 Tax=Neolamprologus brichardi TaxID=32507 RepID=A0A3Q4IBN7_NEOBR
MAVFMDLNVSFLPDRSDLRSVVETAAHHVYFVNLRVTSFLQEIPTPTPINELIDQLPVVQGRSRPIRVLNRLTVVMSDASHFRPNAPEYRRFDLLAVQPTSEKLFHAACMVYDIDIICVPMTEKLPFFFKRAPINGAIDRGVVFEVSYSAAIRDSTMRRYTIANAVSLMESCKGKVALFLQCFLYQRLDFLALLFGLSDGDAKEAVSSTCRAALLHAETRRTASGIIYTTRSQQEAPRGSADGRFKTGFLYRC